MSHTAHPIWQSKGRVPETVMTGHTADISQFAEVGWYDWIQFKDTQIGYPESQWNLGRYLCPSFDVEPAICAKILNENGEVVHRTTYRPLTPNEYRDPVTMEKMKKFNKAIKNRHGSGTTYEDLTTMKMQDYVIPTHEPYKDDYDGKLQPIDDADDDEDVNASTFDQLQYPNLCSG